MKKQLSLLVVAGVLTAPVFAEDFYAGAEVGRTNVKGSGNTKDLKGHATNVGVFAGYQFHPNAAVEVGYRDLGTVKDSDVAGAKASVKGRALHTSLVGIVPVSDEFSLYGRVGVARLSAKMTPKPADWKETKTKPMFGIGARYAVSKEFGLRTEYTQFGKVEGVKVSTLTFGGDYRF
ncbi:porin family protein [Chitinimonas sp. BJB300]|uniref:porin family protein n=1 Tax=Chitinimonas sp. BJB300 TaxID=1559339 RepID=UPI001303F9BD|nr:porin family protein [Chitinimonas sp. BJB300]